MFARSIFSSQIGNAFHSSLTNDDVAFVFLEGATVVIVTVCLTIFHPGLYFGIS